MKNKKNYFMQAPKTKATDVRLYDIKYFDLELMNLESQGYCLVIEDEKPLHVILKNYTIENNLFNGNYPSRFDEAVRNGIISLKKLSENKYFHDDNNHFFTRNFKNCSLVVWIRKYDEKIELPIFAVNYILITRYFNLILEKQDIENLFFFDKEIKNVIHELNAPPYSRSKLMNSLLEKDAKYFLKPLEEYKMMFAFYKSVEDEEVVVYKNHRPIKPNMFCDYVTAKKFMLSFETVKKKYKKCKDFLECKLDNIGVILSYNNDYYRETFIYKKTKYGLMYLELFSNLYNKYEEDAKKLKEHLEKRLELQKILNSK